MKPTGKANEDGDYDRRIDELAYSWVHSEDADWERDHEDAGWLIERVQRLELALRIVRKQNERSEPHAFCIITEQIVDEALDEDAECDDDIWVDPDPPPPEPEEEEDPILTCPQCDHESIEVGKVPNANGSPNPEGAFCRLCFWGGRVHECETTDDGTPMERRRKANPPQEPAFEECRVATAVLFMPMRRSPT